MEDVPAERADFVDLVERVDRADLAERMERRLLVEVLTEEVRDVFTELIPPLDRVDRVDRLNSSSCWVVDLIGQSLF